MRPCGKPISALSAVLFLYAALDGGLRANGARRLPPKANFVLIAIRRDVQDVIPKMLAEGVAVGRHFDSVDRHMRAAMGTEREIEKFKTAFEKVVG